MPTRLLMAFIFTGMSSITNASACKPLEQLGTWESITDRGAAIDFIDKILASSPLKDSANFIDTKPDRTLSAGDKTTLIWIFGSRRSSTTSDCDNTPKTTYHVTYALVEIQNKKNRRVSCDVTEKSFISEVEAPDAFNDDGTITNEKKSCTAFHKEQIR